MKNFDFSSLLDSKKLHVIRISVIAIIVIGLALFAFIGTGKSHDTESGVVAIGFTDFSDTLYSGIDLSNLENKVTEFTGFDCEAEITTTGISKVFSLVMSFPADAELNREELADFINGNFSDISITALTVYQKQPTISRASFIGLLVIALILSGIMMLILSIGRDDKSSAIHSFVTAAASFGFVFALLNIVRMGGVERIYASSLAALLLSWYLLYSYSSSTVQKKSRKKQNTDNADVAVGQYKVSFSVIVVCCIICLVGIVISVLMSRPQVAMTMISSFIAVAGACIVTPVVYFNRK